MKQKLVVVGNGMAGARAAEEVLARARDRFDIVMFGAEPYGNYNRILLSNILSGAQDTSEIFINPLDWYEENGIRLHAGAPVHEIDRAAKVVRSEAGVRERYDKLLIATGSRAFIPPMAGINGPDGKLKHGVFGFRTIDDCNAIVLKAKESCRAVVIGGGLLGLEAARGLLNHGCEVHVVHLAGHLMEMQLDPTGGSILRSSMQAMGVNVHLQKLTTEVLGEDRVTGLAFKDGTTLDCDMVVVSAGIKPNAEIGLRCGLSVERAIVVDNHMRSVSDPNVYVVGECAQHRGRVYGLVAPLWEQAKVFADHITEHKPDAAYHGSKLATKLKVMGVELASMGITEPAEDRDEIIQFTEPKKGTYKKLIVRDGRLVGGILMGDISKAAYLMQCFDRDAPLPDERLSLLFDLGAPSQKMTVEEMPPEMQVCNCNGVSKAAIESCVAGGVRNAAGVMDATRAGKGCGSCKSLVAEIVGWLGAREAEEDASVHYHVPAIPLRKADLVAAIRDKQIKSVPAVFRELAGGVEDAGERAGAGFAPGRDLERRIRGRTRRPLRRRRGTRLRQGPARLQELHRHRLLPLRSRRQHWARGQARAPASRPRRSRQAQARNCGLPAQLLGGADRGYRRGGDRRRQVGDLHRRHRGAARAQGRRALHRRQRGRRAALHRPLHPVLSREREVQGAHLDLRRAHRHRAHPRRPRRRQRGHRGHARRGHARLGRRDL